jgi:hypothetical protein
LLLVGIGGNMPTTPRQDKDNKLAETPNDILEAADGVIQVSILLCTIKASTLVLLLKDMINNGDAKIMHEYTSMNAFFRSHEAKI